MAGLNILPFYQSFAVYSAPTVELNRTMETARFSFLYWIHLERLNTASIQQLFSYFNFIIRIATTLLMVQQVFSYFSNALAAIGTNAVETTECSP